MKRKSCFLFRDELCFVEDSLLLQECQDLDLAGSKSSFKCVSQDLVTVGVSSKIWGGEHGVRGVSGGWPLGAFGGVLLKKLGKGRLGDVSRPREQSCRGPEQVVPIESRKVRNSKGPCGRTSHESTASCSVTISILMF